jgi:hypothetical protein
MTKKQSVSFGWILGGVLVLALALLYTYHSSNAHEVHKTASSYCDEDAWRALARCTPIRSTIHRIGLS